MKKILIGLLAISSVAFAKFEKQFGMVEIMNNEHGKIYNHKDDGSVGIIIQNNSGIKTRNDFYEVVDELSQEYGDNYKVLDSSNSFISFKVMDKNIGTYVYNMFNKKDDTLIIMTGNSFDDMDNLFDYMNVNDYINSNNKQDIAVSQITVASEELKELATSGL